MDSLGVALVGLAIAVGLVGIVVPLLPGVLLVAAGIGVWAWVEGGAVAWTVAGVAAALLVASAVVKYTWPARRMKAAQVRTSVLLVGAVAGLVGFFVVPVVGLVLGFVGGVFGAEVALRRDLVRAWAATVLAVKAVVLSVGIELAGALLAALAWVIGVALTV